MVGKRPLARNWENRSDRRERRLTCRHRSVQLAVMQPLQGKNITIMGLGRFGGGVGATRYCAKQGARVTVTDTADPESLRPSLDALADTPIAALHLGGHSEADFTDADLIVVNPAVRPGNAYVEHARATGAEVTTEAALFIDAFPGQIVGVTGTNGKSTTAAMIAHILRHADGDGTVRGRIRLGGNIGGSLLGQLSEMTPDDIAVLELSSFQLHYFTAKTRRADIAVVTNCVPNHLNWHTNFDDYAAVKQKILQRTDDRQTVVLSSFATGLDSWKKLIRGRCLETSRDDVNHLQLPGGHNMANASCAIAAAKALGVTASDARRALATFQGLPYRIEHIPTSDGVRYYNDSASTTPESTIAGVQAFKSPHLIAGGISKGADLSALATAIGEQAQTAAFFGAVGAELCSLTLRSGGPCRCAVFTTMHEALAWSRRQASSGETILFSPGMASLDQFLNYEDRGRTFTEAVRQASGS